MQKISFNHLKDNIYVILFDKNNKKNITIVKTLNKEYNKKINDYQYHCKIIFDNINNTRKKQDFYFYKKLFKFENIKELIKDEKTLKKKYGKYLQINYKIQECFNFSIV